MKWSDSRSVDRYILATSVSMSPQLKDEILAILDKAVPVSHEDILGREDLNSILGSHPDVERRNFKLWMTSSAVLQRFLNNEIFSRTEELLEGIESRAKYFVQTEEYAEALDTVDQKKACLIVGPPGVGKSLLAEMLILTYSHEGFEVVPISADISEGYSLWDPSEPQIFYYDDFLGQTNIAESLGKNEDNRLSNFISRVENSDNKRFVLTSREQILRSAEARSDRVRWVSSSTGRTVISLSDYSLYARGQILFNHIYFSKMPSDQRAELVEDNTYLEHIAHRNYSPRLVEIVLRRSAHSLAALNTDLTASLENPEALWMGSYNDLSSLAQSILRILLTFPPGGSAEAQLRTALKDGFEPQSYNQALRILENTWIRLRPISGGSLNVDFANPSCRDFIKEQLIQSPVIAEEAIRTVTTVEGMALLYGYSQASNGNADEPARHNAIRVAFEKMTSEVYERLRDMFAAEVSALPKDFKDVNPFYSFPPRDPRPQMLTRLLPLIADLAGNEFAAWVESEISALSSPTHARPPRTVFDATDLLGLAEGLKKYAIASLERQTDLIRFALEQVETWDELEYLSTVATALDIDVTSEDVQEIASQILQDYFEDLRDNNEDIDDVARGADALGYLADDFGLDWSDEVEELIRKVQRMPDHDDALSGPRYRPSPSTPTAISETDAVRELFQGLVD